MRSKNLISLPFKWYKCGWLLNVWFLNGSQKPDRKCPKWLPFLETRLKITKMAHKCPDFQSLPKTGIKVPYYHNMQNLGHLNN